MQLRNWSIPQLLVFFTEKGIIAIIRVDALSLFTKIKDLALAHPSVVYLFYLRVAKRALDLDLLDWINYLSDLLDLILHYQ